MTPLDLSAIKSRCAAATPGPWKASCAPGVASVRSEWANCAIYINVRQNGETPACVTRWHRDAEFIAHSRSDVPALVAEVERLRFLLAECYRATGADPDGNDDAMLAGKAVDAVKRLRAESDKDAEAAEALVAEVERLREWKETHSVSSTLRTRAETAEARVAELERDLADTNRVRADYDHDRREAREALKVAQDRLGELAAAVIAHEDAEFKCGMYANIASPKYADLIESRKRLRTLLAKGGA